MKNFNKGDKVRYVGIDQVGDEGDFGTLLVWDDEKFKEPGWWVNWNDNCFLWASEDELELIQS